MATLIETRKQVEPRPSLWWSGTAEGPVRVATTTAAGQPAAVLVPSGRAGQNPQSSRQRRATGRSSFAGAVCGRSVAPSHLGAQTGRRGGAGPAGACLAVRTPPAAL